MNGGPGWRKSSTAIEVTASCKSHDPTASNPLLGVGLHSAGATFAATCYTPEKSVRGWPGQTYWLAQGFFCWLLLTYGNYLGNLADTPTFPALMRLA
jgi:hypothetical protein